MQSFVTLIGHILGFVSVGLFFYSYQRTQKRKIMIIQICMEFHFRSRNKKILNKSSFVIEYKYTFVVAQSLM